VETVYATAASNDAMPVPTRVLDAVRHEGLEPGTTFGRYPNGSNALDRLASATFGKTNTHRFVGDIVINEIMYQHAARDDRYEYIELYNRSTRTVSLQGWKLTDGIDYAFGQGVTMPPGSYLVVAQDPAFLAAVYNNLTVGVNLVGPYEGKLDNHSERIRLCYPLQETNPKTGKLEETLVTADEVTYYDGGRWPKWADGMGASLELRDPRSDNDTPEAWADSDESAKTHWMPFSFTIDAADNQYTHDSVTVFDLMLLNAGEILLDDLELIVNGSDRLTNGDFERGESSWRILGNHTRSFVTAEDHHLGSQALHLIATGTATPPTINQSITGIAPTCCFRLARWRQPVPAPARRGRSPIMPPRPSGTTADAADSAHRPAGTPPRRQSRPRHPSRSTCTGGPCRRPDHHGDRACGR
jgi:hypothetical protein